MRKFFVSLLLLCAVFASAQTQDTKMFYRIRIQHADPQLVYMLLRGIANFQAPPEMSTQMGFAFSGGNGGFGGSGFGGGKPGMGG